MDGLSNSEAWQPNPLRYPDRLLIDYCHWSIPLSFSSFCLSSPRRLSIIISPSPQTCLSLQTNTRPVVTDKASLTNYKMMEECVSVSSSGFGHTHRGWVYVSWLSLALYYMINSFPSSAFVYGSGVRRPTRWQQLLFEPHIPTQQHLSPSSQSTWHPNSVTLR